MTDTIPPDAAPISKSDEDRLSERSSKSIYLKREPLPSDTVALLRHHAERTGVGAMRLLRGAKDKPSGLSATIVVQWLRGSAQNAVPSHVAYVLNLWGALPTNNRLALTPEMRAQLNAELVRTGMGAVLILKRAQDIPPGLTHQIIQSWVSGGPKPNTVGEAYWNYVIGRLRSLPDGDKLVVHILRSL